MFKSHFQGGAVVEIFSAQGRDPLAKWKLHGGPSAVTKTFDKAVKGFVYILQGSSHTNKMQTPKDSKMTLGLIQRFLVLQVFIPVGKDFSTELTVTDLGNLKRRLYLSTVHKEFSATPLHARIPLSSLRRSTWCNMCIDLVSFTGEVFKGAAFLSLDEITVSASCRLRRVFTMKQPPMEAFREDSHICGSDSADVIPKTFQFPAEVQHVTLLVNMDYLRLVEVKSRRPSSSECEQPRSVRTSSTRETKRQHASHIAFGSKVQGPPPPTGRMNSISEGCGSSPKAGVSSSPTKCSSEDSVENLTLQPEPAAITRPAPVWQPCPQSRPPVQALQSRGDCGPLQPHPPADRTSTARTGSRKLQAFSAGREKPVPTGAAPACTKGGGEPDGSADSETWRTNVTADGSTSQSEGHSSHDQSPGQQLLNRRRVPASLEGSEVDPQLGGPSTGDSVVQQDADPDEEVEPELDLTRVFTFSSQPHYAKCLLGQVPEVSLCSSDWRSDRCKAQRGARMEDDFVVSGSDEDEAYSEFVCQTSVLQPSLGGTSLVPAVVEGHNLDGAPRKPRPESQVDPSPSNPEKTATGLAHPASVVPVRSVSPSGNRPRHALEPRTPSGLYGGCTRTSLSRTSLRELPAAGCRLSVEHTTREGKRELPVSKGTLEMRDLSSVRMQEEEEELQMLASLCRQQEDEEQQEGRHTGSFSVSQIHKCNVSMSTNSDDTSTWIPSLHMPADQGHDYQREIHPLLHSNPRDWSDVFSPPIIPPSEQMRGQGKGGDDGDNVKGGEVAPNRADGEDEFLTLLYDPCLNCYFDPETGKYYELA
ncbi:hypothetical protein GN956_G9991 [Arapaima gigas]